MLILAALQFTHIVDFMILMPLGPPLMRLFSISPREFGLLVSAYTFAAGLSGFTSAFVVDRLDRKHLLLMFYTGFILGTLACALAPSYSILLIARTLSGLFGGVLSAAVMAMVADVIPMERRGRAMGLLTSAFSAASVLGVPLSLWLASWSDWHMPFFFLTALSLLILLLILVVVPTMNGHLGAAPQSHHPLALFRDICQHPPQIWALVLTSLMMIGQFSLIPFISPSMVANVGFRENQLPLIYLCGGLTTLMTGPWIGRLADRYGKLRLLYLFLGLSVLPQLILTHLGPTPLPLVLVFTTCFFVVSGGRMIPSMALITATVSPQRRGSFMSIQSAIQQLSSGLASLLAGMIVVRDSQGHLLHYGTVGWLAAGTTLLCFWIAPRLIVAHPSLSK